MKRTLFFLVAIILVVTACQKNKTSTGCYTCDRYQVTYSSYEVLAVPSHLYAVDTVCHMNAGMINDYIKSHSYYDTIKNSHDTLTFVEHYVVCDNQ